jgi:hypothetical protein
MWLDRQVLRLIMEMTGGPADPQSRVEFTQWSAVDGIASHIADPHHPDPQHHPETAQTAAALPPRA